MDHDTNGGSLSLAGPARSHTCPGPLPAGGSINVKVAEELAAELARAPDAETR